MNGKAPVSGKGHRGEQDRRGGVLGEMAGLVPLVGQVVRRRVQEWVHESRASLRETVREVRRELERELDDAPVAGDGAACPESADASEGTEGAGPTPEKKDDSG